MYSQVMKLPANNQPVGLLGLDTTVATVASHMDGWAGVPSWEQFLVSGAEATSSG